MSVKYQIHETSSNVSDFLLCLSFGEIIDFLCPVTYSCLIPYCSVSNYGPGKTFRGRTEETLHLDSVDSFRSPELDMLHV